jgi:hypothetical protein
MKVYSTAPPAPKNMVELLKEEITRLRHHRHPHIVKYLGTGEWLAAHTPLRLARRRPIHARTHGDIPRGSSGAMNGQHPGRDAHVLCWVWSRAPPGLLPRLHGVRAGRLASQVRVVGSMAA